MSDLSPRFRPVLDTVPVYKPGKAPAAATGQAHKLSSNESPYGPLPSVVEVIAEAGSSVNRYPDNGAEARGARYLLAVGRLLPGLTTASVAAGLDAQSVHLARDFPATNAGRTAATGYYVPAAGRRRATAARHDANDRRGESDSDAPRQAPDPRTGLHRPAADAHAAAPAPGRCADADAEHGAERGTVRPRRPR